ncbi:hypothetical protein E6P09_01505 [Haloferax mediterranei ATCC 33500]|uniref:Transmembrane glycoprotein / HTH domain protein n=1 Tax=Haloferax mediterranei (strain ATCC 33500 / DSM 1411 / JCM 8866 / NBRC 14739 / NCIMB 2177 / R-4) TaxID=523841 RepID=I3R671_HALMT|nr:hypothetical protein [Haloferax mediterranei]AFK19731.2 hypothetical protein HFX_2039 [Haloferax mediterranei ATCC 33500]AHZ23118.1 hypothetical protein BM92_10935 [Haloferax mediterranei ATCC 33500]EMA00052.1 hypothetical protein C439_11968 [Haloferax mediterranei ATCC 33500]MDX5987525.1 hypothetical protein [Haloferax mediterranei ATCC 33500]QCQ74023.1 hypothetical protein E6P09_01505 [Haloferax mediterranei ATCC 33500]
MATRHAVSALLCAVLCVLAVAAPVTAQGSATGPGVEPLVQQGVEPDSTRIVVDVDASGDARWEIQYWTRLDDQNTTDAFQSLQEDVRANPGDYTAAFADRINSTVTAAENATGREMAETNISVSAETRSLPDSYGVVTYSFDWSNFAAVDGDRIVVGDSIEGFFLDSSSRLIVSWPDEYGAVTVEPSADDTRENTAIWRGSQTEFVSGEPSVVLERGAGGPGTTQSPTPDTADSPFSTTGALAALALVAILVGGAAMYLRSRGVFGGGEPSSADSVETTGPTAGPGAASDTAAEADSGDEGSVAGPEPSADEAGDETPSPPSELLSNEERVLRLIESRGGRVKQQEVAGALDWTDAKTSKVVRGMRDEGTIEGFRLGRENVLRLPEDDDSEDQ